MARGSLRTAEKRPGGGIPGKGVFEFYSLVVATSGFRLFSDAATIRPVRDDWSIAPLNRDFVEVGWFQVYGLNSPVKVIIEIIKNVSAHHAVSRYHPQCMSLAAKILPPT